MPITARYLHTRLSLAPAGKLATTSFKKASQVCRGGSNARQVALSVRATQEAPGAPPALVKAVEGFGCDTSEGIFGFIPFCELFVGRVAMIGFGAGMTTELVTGKGFLMQIGLCSGSPNILLFAALTLLMGGATAAAAKQTISEIQSADMSVVQYKRWAEFRSQLPGADLSQLRADMKEYEEKVSLKQSEQAMPEEEGEQSDGESDSPEMEVAPNTAPTSFGGLSEAAELEYAKGVELTNGRWAMVGFATAILIESYSGAGVVAQLLGYMQASGILGEGTYELLVREFTQYRI